MSTIPPVAVATRKIRNKSSGTHQPSGDLMWLGDRVGPYPAEDSNAPVYAEVSSADAVYDSIEVTRALLSIDWAFADDDTSYLSHDVHPYPAKFIPQIPGHLIAHLSLRGELVLDPFGGSGTTALEAVRLGRRAISVDANPLAALIGRVKTARIDKAVLADLHGVRASLMVHETILPPDSSSLVTKYQQYIPDIPNREKWFPDSSCGELALIRSCIEQVGSQTAKNMALLAMSRVILKVSFQDSETRYASRPREIPVGETIRRYLTELDFVAARVIATAPDVRYGIASFVTADVRGLDAEHCQDESIDLIVTSPPYGNAFDYHLYHRFRLLWLGFDPRNLASVEIGSHLRHQRAGDGFDAYLADMVPCLEALYRVLKAGRYAALVIGDAIYRGTTYPGAESVSERAEDAGFETVCIIPRPIHQTRRSVLAAGRRASAEKILVLRKPLRRYSLRLEPPPYRLWDYEVELRQRETSVLLSVEPPRARATEAVKVDVEPCRAPRANRLTFSHAIRHKSGFHQPTWQAILENGLATVASSRKDPKYVTHGLHPYKGKFYPQLAKGLINIAGLAPGATVFDPFCGSGTTLLECYLNGLKPYGCDLHPLAAKIASAKVGVLEVSPSIVSEAVAALQAKLEAVPSDISYGTGQFREDAIEEIASWFPRPVVAKINWLLHAIRSLSAGTLRDFLEVILSSILREVSQQDPTDLRIRRRKKPVDDADVLGLFGSALQTQYGRIERFWSIRGYCPHRFWPGTVCEGDSRDQNTLGKLGLSGKGVDFILTSPPYATALPYIDTDRLSLLVLHGMTSGDRRPLEEGLTGSREIRQSEKKRLEQELNGNRNLPNEITVFLQELHAQNSKPGVGFRRRNMPALLLRFFVDMKTVLLNCANVLKPGAEAMLVLGDSRTKVQGKDWVIPTTRFVRLIAGSAGLEPVEQIPISVTTDNHKHVKNAITENAVIRVRRPVQSP